MTKDEALKLALEAFGEIEWSNNSQWQSDRAKVAINAIKEALEQPEQEPVAWRNAAIRIGEELSSVGPDGYYDMTAEQWLDWAMEQEPRGKNSLAQRTWVGLTPDELNAIFDSMKTWNSFQITDVYFAIEAKLKAKNT